MPRHDPSADNARDLSVINAEGNIVPVKKLKSQKQKKLPSCAFHSLYHYLMANDVSVTSFVLGYNTLHHMEPVDTVRVLAV